MTTNTLQVNQLGCVRQGQALFMDMSWQLHAGEILLVTGANGSGKSSLLRLLTGLATPALGDITWCGAPIQKVRNEYAQQLHYIGHTNGIKLGLTVEENLELAKALANTSSRAASSAGPSDFKPAQQKSLGPALEAARDDKLGGTARDDKLGSTAQDDILIHLNIHQHKDTLAKNLSAGQKRRVALARLFLVSKPLWIIDEPLTALDTTMQTLFLAQLKQHLHNGGMAVISSHHSIAIPDVSIQHLRLTEC